MLGTRLKQVRASRGWSQKDLAEASGFSRASIINWESEKRAPRTADLERLAEALEVPVQDFLEEGEPKEPTAFKPRTSERKISAPGLDYWGGVVENARRSADVGKDLPLIKTMLMEAVKAIDAAQSTPRSIEEKEYTDTNEEPVELAV